MPSWMGVVAFLPCQANSSAVKNPPNCPNSVSLWEGEEEGATTCQIWTSISLLPPFKSAYLPSSNLPVLQDEREGEEGTTVALAACCAVCSNCLQRFLEIDLIVVFFFFARRTLRKRGGGKITEIER